jgi:hypothetical protein
VANTQGKQHLHLRRRIDIHACFGVAVGDSILICIQLRNETVKLIFCRKGPKIEGGVSGVRLIQGADCIQFFWTAGEGGVSKETMKI